MKISSVSNSWSSTSINSNSLKLNANNSNSSNDPVIDDLNAQKDNLKNQISKLKESASSKNTDSQKVINEQIKQLEAQIQQIDIQIQQEKIKKKAEEAQKAEEERQKEQEKNSNTISQSDKDQFIRSSLIDANTNLYQAKQLTSTKKQLQGQARNLDREIKTDAGKGFASTAYQQSSLEKVDSNLTSVDGYINAYLNNTAKSLENIDKVSSKKSANKDDAIKENDKTSESDKSKETGEAKESGEARETGEIKEVANKITDDNKTLSKNDDDKDKKKEKTPVGTYVDEVV